MKIPLFIGAAIILWPQGKLIPIIFVIFLVLQGYAKLLSVVAMLPVRFSFQYFLVKKYGPHMGNMEGMAMNFVINRWQMKLLPAGEAFKFYQMDSEDIEFYKLHGKESFMRAYEKRPFLNSIVFFLWLSVVINVIKALYFLVTGSFGNIGMSAFWAVLSFTLWYAIHNWALRHPKR